MNSPQYPANTPSEAARHARIEPARRALFLRASEGVARSGFVDATKERLGKCAGLFERAALAVRRSKQQPGTMRDIAAQGSARIGMDEKLFGHPLRVHLAELGTVRYVCDVHEALDCLMYGWPARHSPHHARALDTCLKVLEKRRSTIEAEAAFGEAAEQAGILVHGPMPR